MSWPYPYNFSQPNQFINGFPSYHNPFYVNQYNPNPLINTLPNPYFNYTPNHCLFPQNYTQHPIAQYSRDPRQITQQKNNNQHFIVKSNSDVQKKQSHSESLSKSQNSQQNENDNDQVKIVRFRRRRALKKQKNSISHNSSLRNDTKNIPKNYGKAMLSYIQKNSRQTKELLSTFEVDFLEFMMVVKSFKSKINTIHDLRQMWGQNQKQDNLKKCIRILSFHFMRMKCLPYIFNSRVKNYHTHIKYRKKIMEGIENPQNFTKIKQF